MTDLTTPTAFWFLITAGPIALFVIWDDLAHLKIRNVSVMASLICFVVVGFIVLPWQVVLWQLGYGFAALFVTFTLFTMRIMGGGDAKYIAAITPFFAWPDWALILMLFCGITITALITHKLAKMIGFPRLTPHWASWTSGNRFPLGFPLGALLLAYLNFSIIG